MKNMKVPCFLDEVSCPHSTAIWVGVHQQTTDKVCSGKNNTETGDRCCEVDSSPLIWILRLSSHRCSRHLETMCSTHPWVAVLKLLEIDCLPKQLLQDERGDICTIYRQFLLHLGSSSHHKISHGQGNDQFLSNLGSLDSGPSSMPFRSRG